MPFIHPNIAPVRMHLVNLQTNERMEAQFNPDQLTLGLTANWAQINVPGMSHPILQYTNTSATSIQLTLYMDAGSTNRPSRLVPGDSARNQSRDPALDSLISSVTNTASADSLQNSIRFLTALAYAPESDAILKGAPPRTLLVWPNYVTLTCVLQSLNLVAERFNVEGYPVNLRAEVQLLEIRDLRITQQLVRERGFQRGTPAEVIPTDISEFLE